MAKKRKQNRSVLETFDALIDALTRRKRWWTPAERSLYNAMVRSICKSVLRQKAAHG